MNNIRKVLLFSKLSKNCSVSLYKFSHSKSFLSCTPQKYTTSHRLDTARFIHAGSCLLSANVQKAVETKDETGENQQSDDLDSKLGKFAELATDVEKKKKILMILMEHEVAKLDGKRVPSRLTFDDMKELLPMFSFSSRAKYMGFLHERECRKIYDRKRREVKAVKREEWMIEKEHVKPPDHIQYGIGHNTMIIRLRRASIMRYANQRLANSVLYGQKFFIDMDYDCFMRKQDCNNLGEQLLELYSVNRKNTSPYDLTLCNVDHSSTTMQSFGRYMPNLFAPDNFLTVTEMSYLDLFPKEKLIYVTPHAKDPMRTYDPNAVYIIGGLVDKCIREPVALAKAKREGIRAVHLPFDEYLMWGRGSKSLPLNQLLEIMLEMKNTQDWGKAMSKVPSRKLVRSLDMFSEF